MEIFYNLNFLSPRKWIRVMKWLKHQPMMRKKIWTMNNQSK